MDFKLTEDEKARGFVRPLRVSYVHDPCGSSMIIDDETAEMHAKDPKAVETAWCPSCRRHYPLGEKTQFRWHDGSKVGT